MKDLAGLPLGAGGYVADVAAEKEMARRLMDLGFTRGAFVRCLFAAPGGGMRAYRIRQTVVALRSGNAKQIKLEDTP